MGKVKECLRQHKQLLTLFTCLAVYCSLSILLHIPCPILWFTGVSCPGCGITRALLCLCRLDFAGAVYYNPSIFAVVLAAVLLLICYFRKDQKTRKIVLVGIAWVMIGVYLYRFFILHAPVLQFCPAKGCIPRLWRWICSLL